MQRLRNTRGFSLMELLIVIALIAFMLGFLTMVFINNTAKAKTQAARALLQKLEIGLSRYYEIFREYPPDSGYGLDPDRGTMGTVTLYDAGSLYRYLGQKVNWKKPVDQGGTVDMGSYGPFVDFTSKELKEYTDTQFGESKIVIDPWKNAVGYIGDKRRKIHKRDGVDLYSAGPDGRTASDDAPGSMTTKDGKSFDHHWPSEYAHDNNAYDNADNNGDGVIDNAPELGYAVLNGCLTKTKKDKVIDVNDKSKSEVLDDINNWDPE